MKRGVWITVGGAVIALIAGGAYFIFRPATPSPIPVTMRESISRPLYVPKEVPKDWSVTKDSAVASDGIIVYSVTTGHGDIAVTQQPLPPASFDFEAFYKQSLSGAVPYSTKYGTAAIGKANGRYVGSLVAGKTWILLSTTSTAIQENDMRQLFEHLELLN